MPLGILVLATARALREDAAERQPKLDILGTVLSGCAIAALVVPVIEGNDAGWPGWVWPTLAAGPIFTALLAVHVRRTAARGRDPIIEPSLFRNRGFPSALITSLLYFAVSTGVVFVTVVYLETGLHRSVLAASLTILPFAAGLAIASLAAGQYLVPRYGNRVLFAGVMVLAAGLVATGVAIAGTAIGAYPPLLPAALGVCGLGGGLVTVPFFTAALARVRPPETGSASGLLNAVQQLGGTAGVAVLGTVYLATLHPNAGAACAILIATGLAGAIAVSASLMLREHRNE